MHKQDIIYHDFFLHQWLEREIAQFVDRIKEKYINNILLNIKKLKYRAN